MRTRRKFARRGGIVRNHSSPAEFLRLGIPGLLRRWRFVVFKLF
jgi:hypothetical protein